MQPGQFLVNKDGRKCKVLGVCGEVIFKSNTDNFDVADSSAYTLAELKKFGWSPLEEPWKPTLSEFYWYVNEDGNFGTTNWGIDGMEEHDFRYSIGNVHQNLSGAKLYRQKLIERMGRKED